MICETGISYDRLVVYMVSSYPLLVVVSVLRSTVS
jgi:hypothetical protein